MLILKLFISQSSWAVFYVAGWVPHSFTRTHLAAPKVLELRREILFYKNLSGDVIIVCRICWLYEFASDKSRGQRIRIMTLVKTIQNEHQSFITWASSIIFVNAAGIQTHNDHCRQRILAFLLRGGITIQLASCLSGLNSTKQVNILIILK